MINRISLNLFLVFICAFLICCSSKDDRDFKTNEDTQLGTTTLIDVDKDVKLPYTINNLKDSAGLANQEIMNSEIKPAMSPEECVKMTQVNIKKVLSGNKVVIGCETLEFIAQYIGIKLLKENPEKLERSKSLNEFLVLGKDIEIDIISEVASQEYESIYLVELYSHGESINLRLLASGLVDFADMPDDFDRAEEYKKQFMSHKENRDPHLMPGAGGNSIFGCGTLPCKPKN